MSSSKRQLRQCFSRLPLGATTRNIFFSHEPHQHQERCGAAKDESKKLALARTRVFIAFDVKGDGLAGPTRVQDSMDYLHVAEFIMFYF